MTNGIARRRILQFAWPLLLAGCATLAPPPADNTARVAATHGAQERTYFDAIDLGGRLSVRYQNPNSGKEEGLHGSFAWMQDPEQTRVTLLSPLGQTIAVITITAEGATLMQGGRTVHSAADVERLVGQTLGWPLPIAGLHEWLQGFGIDAAGRRFMATPQAPEVTTRDNWHIRYVNWDDGQAFQPIRPKRIDLERNTAEAGDVSIRIVIDNWIPH